MMYILTKIRELTPFKYFRIVCIINVLLYIVLSYVQLFQPQEALESNLTIEPKNMHLAVSNIPRTIFQVSVESHSNISVSQDVLLRSNPQLIHSNSNNHTHKQYNNPLRKLIAFDTAMTSKERRLLQDILLKFKAVLEENEITFFMYSGTLLGSHRHHDIIPWDDDIDIIISSKYKTQLKSVLTNLRPFFFLNTLQNIRWKFFSIQSRPIKKLSWSWPFLDISFYHENSTHIWDSDYFFRKNYTFLKSDVFPLTRRPLMGMLLPAPRNTSAVLKNYKPEICTSKQYNHKYERIVPRKSQVNCEKLKIRFPFVIRKRVMNGFNETLLFGGKILRWFFTKNM